MKLHRYTIHLPVLIIAALGLWEVNVSADNTRTQSIALHKGWNSIFLEVYPLVADPAAIFANTPVDIAASYYAHNSSTEFMANPGSDMFKKAGWGVWYAGNRPDAFLKTLYAIYGQQCYLVHAQSDYTWTVTGAATPPSIRWQANAYNFVGFSVSTQAAPTFAQFFSGSTAHNHNRLYRLSNDVWRRVVDPSAEVMQSGEAFWIYSDGASKYQGPLQVETKSSQGLLLGSATDVMTLRNPTDHPVTPTIQHVPVGGDSTPLAIVVTALGDKTVPIQSLVVPQPDGAWTQALPPLEAGAAIQVPFQLRVQDATKFMGGSLLKISTDLGTEVWLPVIAMRKDLENQ
jgi:hypothetical protein